MSPLDVVIVLAILAIIFYYPAKWIVELFTWFRKKKLPPERLIFTSNEDAFEHCCNFMDCSIIVGKTIPAIITETAGHPSFQNLTVKLPNQNGGVEVPSISTDRYVSDLKPGDFVGFLVRNNSRSISGIVINRLLPEFEVGKGWIIKRPGGG